MRTSKFYKNKNFDSHQKSLISEKRGFGWLDAVILLVIILLIVWLIKTKKILIDSDFLVQKNHKSFSWIQYLS